MSDDKVIKKYEDKFEHIYIDNLKKKEFSLENTINEIINYYESNKPYKDYTDNDFFNYILYKISRSNKKDYKEYIRIIKKKKLYNYSSNKNTEIGLRYYSKLYLFIYYLKNKIFTFFITKYSIFNNHKVQYLIRHFTSRGIKKVLSREVYIDYIELVITTKCSLKCKNCANFICYYKKPYDVDEKMIKKSVKKLFEAVDYVDVFRVIGGEPFCNNKIKEYLKVLPYDKIGNVKIATNGTIVPNDRELIEILKNKNISLDISDYKKAPKQTERLIKLLNKEKINYEVNAIGEYWYDFGKPINYKRSKKDLNKQFMKCNSRCKSILNGCIYYCPRASHGFDLKVIPRNESEYINLLNNPRKVNRKEIRKLMCRNKYIEACNYCKYGTDECKLVVPGIQINEENR